ncbi:MAG TPA: magnesium transporter [Actinophytocola sp.]|uniref:magnesium transporter n=1 Tax=Actinophytocola sp. TaxID=1872138 RepID=UPI002DBAC717|nr:magnesium transporter [Actinophytocola sp.]HEU5471151.1 magnesium transporter [Actinophytocola sp.]
MTLTVLALVAALLIAVRRHRRAPRTPASRGRSRALLLVIAVLGFNLAIGGPAMAQDSCAEAPNPERPGSGMVGALDPPQGQGEANSPYLNYGYAGMIWHVYEDNCGPLSTTVTDPSTTIDTWAGNELFNVGKNIVGATNSLHYTLLNGGVLGGLNEQIGKAASAVFDNIFTQLFSLFMLVLAVLLFRQIWRGDLATVSRRTLFALGGMWLAASTLVLVNNYGRIDDLIVNTTTGIQAGFVDPDEDRITRDVLPTDLHTKVVYENWLRGEFGNPDDPKAADFGPRLLNAQAWTWEDVRQGKDADNAAENAKKEDYKKVATELGPATGYFKGTDGSRVGSGFLAMLQSIVYSLFQLFAKLSVLLAQLLLRILTLTAPIIGLVALLHHDILRRVGKAVGAVILNVLVLAMLAGVHFRFLQLIFSEQAKLSLLTQMLLAAIVTVIFLAVGRPMRRMWQMVELSVGAAGAAMPGARGGLFSKFRGRKSTEPTPQDVFWQNLRGSDVGDDPVPASSGVPGTRRPRPEASNPVTATAQRLDTRTAITEGTTRALPAAGPQYHLEPAGSPGSPPRDRQAVVARASVPSRVVDTAPVTDRGWDRAEDAVVVPSRVSRRGEAEFYDVTSGATAPRPADIEEVAGRPVHVVYRPSRGIEMAAPTPRPPRRLPMYDAPRYTDTVVR